MNILVLADRFCNPHSEFVKTANSDHTYTVYIVPYGNYINYYDILTHLQETSIIKEYEHVIVQGKNEKNFCFYRNVWLSNLLEYPSQQENVKFYAADNDYLIWHSGVFDTPVSDQLQNAWNMQVNEPQQQYLEGFVNNNEIETIMQGSRILLTRALKKLGIEYTIIEDIENENLDIRAPG